MDSTSKADSIDEALWTHPRPTIERLYMRDHKTLKAVAAYMLKHHDFDASKSQYEKRFKTWRWRKNLTRAEWRDIIKFVKENSICIEQVEVLFHGDKLPKERIDREITRYGSSDNLQGVCKLPGAIIIRPQSGVPNMDIANGLHVTPALALTPRPHVIQDDAGHEPYYQEIFRTHSPSIASSYSRDFFLGAGHDAPFSWMRAVNWNSFARSMSSPKQLVQWKQPSEMQLDAMFHPKRQTLAGLPYANGKMELPFFLTASLLNDIALSGIVTSTDAYELFKTIPSGEVLRSLQAIAAPILDALRERIFFAALNAGDADIVRAMLELGVNPSEKIMTRMPYPSFELTLVCPLEFSVASRHFLVAKTLISHLCRDATPSQADELLGHVLKAIQKERYQYPEQEIERTELICIALAAGASPVQECLGNNSYAVPLSSVQQFIEAGATEVAAWLQVGLLDLYLDTHYGVQESQDHRERLAQEVLRFILSENMHRIPPGNPHVRQVLLQAARCALLARHVWAVGIILQGFESLGYHLDDNLARKDVTGDSVVQACASGHWELAESYVTAPTRHPVTVPARHPETASEANLVPKIDLEEQLEQIILENDITSICDFWSDLLRKSPEQGLSIVEKSVKLGYYQMAIATIQRLEDEFKMGLQGLVVLMQHGQIATISAVLETNPDWHSALEAASKYDDFDALETMMYQTSPPPKFFVSLRTATDLLDQQQARFRVVAFHAMATNDFRLFKWLLSLSLDVEELVYLGSSKSLLSNNDNFDQPIYFTKFRTDAWRNEHVVPSLLAIAAEQNRLSWIKFLLAERADVRDSMALLRAVQFKAEPPTIRYLLDTARCQKCSGKHTYGSAALQQAVRYRDSGTIALLCEGVDVDGIELSNEEVLTWNIRGLSPLGEAILMNDLEMVQLLLGHGASPSACVSQEVLARLENVKNLIPRATPLITAIDMQSLPIVQLLVQEGAEIDYTRRRGIPRTPLQRAAEMGNIDIIRYLIDRGALVDTKPAHSGGTALQLAAMNGYVGIVTYLLEHGANPNYPPAAGEFGRTAFEAATEQGRIDVMTLLMQSGVQLDLQVGEPPESQRERAMRFAEKKGLMASKRFVEHLYWLSPTDGMSPFGFMTFPME